MSSHRQASVPTAEGKQPDRTEQADLLHTLVEGAEQQVGTGEFAESGDVDTGDPRTAEQDPAQERSGGEVPSDEEEGGLDESLEETFPASDPPSQTIPHRRGG